MTDKQPEALRIADMVECAIKECRCSKNDAAAELRRLHEVNVKLVEALQAFTKCWVRPFPSAPEDMYRQQQVIDQANAALAKAEGK